MTKLLVVCLGVILSLPVNETFSLAERVGNIPRCLFPFLNFRREVHDPLRWVRGGLCQQRYQSSEEACFLSQ